MQYLKSQMPVARNAKREYYMYTVGAFGAVVVVADLLVSWLSQLSDAQVQNSIFAIVLMVCAFIAGSVTAGRKATHAKAVPAKKSVLPAKKRAVKTKGVACIGEPEATHAAKRLVQARCTTPTASPVQAAQPTEPQPAEPAVEPEASRAARDAEPQLESPQKKLRAPQHDPLDVPGARISTEIEDTTSKSPGGEETGQSLIDALALEAPRHDPHDFPGERISTELEDTTNKSPGGEEIGQSEIDAPAAGGCIMDGVAGLADESRRTCSPPVDAAISQNDPTCNVQEETSAEDEPNVLHTAQNGPTCNVQEEASAEDEAQNGPTCNIQEETSAVDEPDVLHTATERTPLRREASTFVPTCWKGNLQVPSEMSLLRCWIPPPPGLCDELPRVAMQRTESRCDVRTTVMLRNLPVNFHRDDLIRAMDAKGFAGFYDFVYMPIDFKTRCCMGYAFANLVTQEEAQRFMLAFNGFKDWPYGPSSKVCAVCLSRTQGLEANILRHQNSPIMTEGVPERFRPVLFDGTRRIPFPVATRELPALLHNPFRR